MMQLQNHQKNKDRLKELIDENLAHNETIFSITAAVIKGFGLQSADTKHGIPVIHESFNPMYVFAGSELGKFDHKLSRLLIGK